jgi:hypothetical protein
MTVKTIFSPELFFFNSFFSKAYGQYKKKKARTIKTHEKAMKEIATRLA